MVHKPKAKLRLELQSEGASASFMDFTSAGSNPSHWYYAQPGRDAAGLTHLAAATR